MISILFIVFTGCTSIPHIQGLMWIADVIYFDCEIYALWTTQSGLALSYIFSSDSIAIFFKTINWDWVWERDDRRWKSFSFLWFSVGQQWSEEGQTVVLMGGLWNLIWKRIFHRPHDWLKDLLLEREARDEWSFIWQEEKLAHNILIKKLCLFSNETFTLPTSLHIYSTQVDKRILC